MNIYPQDLGIRRHVELIRRRAAAVGTQRGPLGPAAAGPPRPRMGLLGRFWAHGSGLTQEQAAAALPAAGRATLTATYLAPYLAASIMAAACAGADLGAATAGAIVTASAIGASGVGALFGRHQFRSLHRKPLVPAEVEAFPSAAYDELERAYLALVINAIRQSVPADAEQQVRDALRAFGEAIDRLPAVPPIADEAGDLRSKADALRAQAQGEADPVIAESLERRAESLLRRADTVGRTVRFTRRALVVRQEILAQIETLHAGLAAFDLGAGDVGDLKQLAHSVRQVAVEADSLAAAREELSAFLDAPIAEQSAEVAPIQITQSKG